jgi:chaperonin GroEL
MKNLPGFRTPAQRAPVLREPAIVLQPQTYQDLKNGVDLIAEAVRPTLGPLPRLVALERMNRAEAPEIMDDGATIARRIIEVVPASHDVGAMLLRHALWQMHTEAGDGSVTMAVMFQGIVSEGIRYITAGGCNAMQLRRGLEKGLQAVCETLRAQACPLEGRESIARVARGLVHENEPLANMLGEMLDVVGPEGLIAVEKSNRPGLEREYVQGAYWRLSGWLSRLFIMDHAAKRALLENPAILMTDLSIREPQELAPVLDACMKAGVQRLVIVAKEISDSALGLLVMNNEAKTIQTLAVRTPRVLEQDQVAALEDMAVLTGGRAFFSAAGRGLHGFVADDLGHARKVWAAESTFGLSGGRGDARRIRRHLADVRARVRLAADDHEREMLQERLGRLAGGTAILRVGGATDAETELLKDTALRAVTALRKAVAGGVVPGGGAALLAARSALAGLPAVNEDQAAAYRLLARALEEPTRAIAANAGSQPDIIIERVRSAGDGCGFDARTGQIVDMKQVGILDSVQVLQRALEIAVTGAATALTMDVIVHHRKPQECVEP